MFGNIFQEKNNCSIKCECLGQLSQHDSIRLPLNQLMRNKVKLVVNKLESLNAPRTKDRWSLLLEECPTNHTPPPLVVNRI